MRLRRTCTRHHSPQPGASAGRSADDLDVFRLGPLLALGDVELDLLPLLEAAVAAAGDRAEVHEHVLATVDSDEAVALIAVEPLHSALRHLDLLGCGCGALWPVRARTCPIAAASLPQNTLGRSTVRPANCPGPEIPRRACHYVRRGRAAAMQGSRRRVTGLGSWNEELWAGQTAHRQGGRC